MATKEQKTAYQSWVKTQPNGTTNVKLDAWVLLNMPKVNGTTTAPVATPETTPPEVPPTVQPEAPTVPSAQGVPVQAGDTVITIDPTPDVSTTDKPDARKHGPYATEAEARLYPVHQLKPLADKAANPVAPHYVDGDGKASAVAVYKPLDLYSATVTAATLRKLVEQADANGGTLVTYHYCMNYHHDAIQSGKQWGIEYAMCSNGARKSGAVAAAKAEAAASNARASEAEQRAAKAEADRIAAKQVADSMRTAQILMLVQMHRKYGVGVLDAMDPAIRAEVEAALLTTPV